VRTALCYETNTLLRKRKYEYTNNVIISVKLGVLQLCLFPFVRDYFVLCNSPLTWRQGDSWKLLQKQPLPSYRIDWAAQLPLILPFLILDIGTRWRWEVSFTIRLLYLRENLPRPRFPLDRRPGWSQGWYRRYGKERNFSPLWESNTDTSACRGV
jgi:hypothetical protein